MESFHEFLEMALPTSRETKIKLYHGTSEEENALKIIKEGLKGKDIQGKSFLSPVKNKVYLSQNLSYALIYALGADIAGHDFSMKTKSQYGYIFIINGNDLKDIQPDEDSVGKFIHEKSFSWLNNIAERYVHKSRMKRIMDGEYIYYASVGKQIMTHLNDWQKLELIKHGSHIAHEGSIKPSECYKIDKNFSKVLKKDGSNFYQYAEKLY